MIREVQKMLYFSYFFCVRDNYFFLKITYLLFVSFKICITFIW